MGNGSNNGYFETNGGHHTDDTNQTGQFTQDNGLNQMGYDNVQGYNGFDQSGQYQNNQYNTGFDPLIAQKMSAQYLLWLILGILQSLSICCCNWFGVVTGILTIVMVVRAKKAFQRGDMYRSMSSLKAAMIINIIGWVLLIVTSIVNIVAGTFSVIFNAFGGTY